MSNFHRISKAFENALHLPLTKNSKYVIFSDCHRGTGGAGDNFLKNEFIYLAALNYYFTRKYTYIELGDGDELWENRSLEDIKNMHPDTFHLMEQYLQENRMYAVYGNHDIVKKRKCFYSGIILDDTEGKRDIYLTHGHQADLLNSTLWPLARFLVRYIWKPLESLGIPDPTSAAKNNTKKKKTEERLTVWASENRHLLVTGHTHHPMIGTKDSPYCNTGSCISPAGITCIEIDNRCLSLVKWGLASKSDQTVYVQREILGEKTCIDEY